MLELKDKKQIFKVCIEHSYKNHQDFIAICPLKHQHLNVYWQQWDQGKAERQ